MDILEDTYILQIKYNPKVSRIFEKLKINDFYCRMEYLSKHPAFSKLGFFTQKKLAYEMLTL